MANLRRLWSAAWVCVFLIGLGTLFYIDNLPEYKGKDIFLPGLLILLGMLLLIGGIIRWFSSSSQ